MALWPDHLSSDNQKTILARSCEAVLKANRTAARQKFHLVENPLRRELNWNLKCRYASRFETPLPESS